LSLRLVNPAAKRSRDIRQSPNDGRVAAKLISATDMSVTLRSSKKVNPTPKELPWPFQLSVILERGGYRGEWECINSGELVKVFQAVKNLFRVEVCSRAHARKRCRRFGFS
jgi:hypothetical protein